MNIKNRIKYYLGVNLFNSTPITIETDEKITSKDLLTKSNENNKSNILYDIPLYKILKRCDKLNAYFLRKFGDIANPINKYCFVKNRSVGEEKTIILKSLNKNRHWCNVYNKPNDIPFDKKKNKIIWRGTTTGNKERTGNRFLLVENFFDNKNIKVGFSHITASIENESANENEYKKYVKGKMDIEDMLKYKYILSVEGNDKDSGINWKLNSNSLVLMCKPTKFSWLMEDKLIPDYHYVLLKDDYSDLEEKLLWCNQNPSKCKKIIQNANNYMNQFMDIKRETFIENSVIQLYFEKLNFV